MSTPGATPPDVNTLLGDVTNALSTLQTELGTESNLFNATVGILNGRANTLDLFQKPTVAGTKIPRAHLQDTYLQAIDIYNHGITALQGLAGSGVLNSMLVDANNKPEIDPTGTLDRTLSCPGAAAG